MARRGSPVRPVSAEREGGHHLVRGSDRALSARSLPSVVAVEYRAADS